MNKTKLTNNDFLSMLKTMLRIRLFEEEVINLSRQGLLGGAAHLYIGEEAIATGVCSALRKEDVIISTHRGHGHCIAKGGDLNLMMAELLGRVTGYCKGKGGSMHIADYDLGICGANGIVGGGLPISVGLGLTSKLKNTHEVAVCFFGDGASNEGSFHEALNMASVWKVPTIYICENNQYAISTHVSRSTSVENIADRAAAYGIQGIVVDGNDVEAVYKAAITAIENARSNKGPTLIECKTYRIEGHYAGDPCVYRNKAEVKNWRKEDKDPIMRLEAKLKELVTAEKIEAIHAEVAKEIEEAVAFAKASPYPSIDSVETDVFTNDPEMKEVSSPPAGDRIITIREALNEAISEEMSRDERVFLLGEDVGKHGGAFQVSKGLVDKFGPERVRDTPISEAAIMGCGTGAAIRGLRPIVEIQYIDFTTVAMDQIVNQAAKLHYMFGGKINVPLVLRAPGGTGGRGNAAQHSQSLEAWFMHVPGLKVVMPSNPYDAKGLLKAAIRDDNPVVFVEHKVQYNSKGPVPTEEYIIPLGVADIKRDGQDITVVATGRMVEFSLQAAEKLTEEGIDVEVVDPRTLVPLDIATISSSVKKTGRVLVVTEDCKTAGVSAELSASIIEECFDDLDLPIQRLSGLNTPIPYAPILERASVPSVEGIMETIRKMTQNQI